MLSEMWVCVCAVAAGNIRWPLDPEEEPKQRRPLRGGEVQELIHQCSATASS